MILDNGPCTRNDLAAEQVVTDLNGRIQATLSTSEKPQAYPENTPILIGHPCLRFLVWCRTQVVDHWFFGSTSSVDDLAAEAVFAKFLNLTDSRYGLVLMKSVLWNDELELSGQLGWLLIDSRSADHYFPVKVFGYAPAIWERINSPDQMLGVFDLKPRLDLYNAIATMFLSDYENTALVMVNMNPFRCRIFLLRKSGRFEQRIWQDTQKRCKEINGCIKDDELPPAAEYNELVCGACKFRTQCKI